MLPCFLLVYNNVSRRIQNLPVYLKNILVQLSIVLNMVVNLAPEYEYGF
jgi:hypothetical protein